MAEKGHTESACLFHHKYIQTRFTSVSSLIKAPLLSTPPPLSSHSLTPTCHDVTTSRRLLTLVSLTKCTPQHTTFHDDTPHNTICLVTSKSDRLTVSVWCLVSGVWLQTSQAH